MIIGINARLFIKDKMEGVATYIFENTKRMVSMHPEDQFVFFFDRKYDPSFIFADNITAVIVYPPARHPILWELWWQWQIPRYLKKYKVDVFYTGEIFMPRKTDVPVAIVSHDLAYLHYPEQIPARVRKYYHRTYPQNHQQADKIIAVSEFTKSDIVDKYDIEADRVEVIYNATPEGFSPIDDSRKQAIKDEYSNGHDYFVYLGSLHPRKNIVNLLKGFDQFKVETNSKYKLILMGRWAWHTDAIKLALQNSPYVSDIIVINDVGKEKYDLLAASEALFYISMFEGFGIPILEGFSSGVPVVTSNISSMPEVANDAAYLVNPMSIKEISQSMKTLSSDDQLKTSLINKGFERVKAFDWDISARKTYAALKALAH